MNAVHYASVWSVNSSAQKNILAVDTKIDLDSHAKTCEGGQQFSVIHDHSRPVIVIGYDPKAGSKYGCIFGVTVAYNKSETIQAFILLINEEVEIKGLNYHLLCPCNEA